MIAQTPSLPYYAVIFTSVRTEGDHGFAKMADRMVEFTSQQDGFLGVESARSDIGITVSYCRDLESIRKWHENSDHTTARKKVGKNGIKLLKSELQKLRTIMYSRGNKLNSQYSG